MRAKALPHPYEMGNLVIAPAEDQYWTEPHNKPHNMVKDTGKMYPSSQPRTTTAPRTLSAASPTQSSCA